MFCRSLDGLCWLLSFFVPSPSSYSSSQASYIYHTSAEGEPYSGHLHPGHQASLMDAEIKQETVNQNQLFITK